MGLIALIAVFALTGCNDIFAAGWGDNRFSQLGDGTLESSSTPIAVDDSDALRDKVVVQVDSSGTSSCALTADGDAVCWGAWPPIGVGLTEPIAPQEVPTGVALAGKTISRVVNGDTDRCALTTDGSVVCGLFPGGEPYLKAGALTGRQAVLLEVGDLRGCAFTADGALACWTSGTQQSVIPKVINDTGVLAGKQIVDLAKAYNSMCALTSDGEMACWGSNFSGQLGDGTTINSEVPVSVVQTGVLSGKTVVGIGNASANHICAVTSDGTAACWGANPSGQLGDGTTVNSSTPVAVKMVGALAGKRIIDIATGGGHTCALLDDATVACWGSNSMGQLGDGGPIDPASEVNSLVPVAVLPLPAGDGSARPVIGLAAGGGYSMGVYQEMPESYFVPMAPQRVLDTRVSPGTPVTDGIVVNVQGVVPPGVTAVTYNVTATGQTASGVATLAPSDSPITASQSSVLNWSGPQQTIANGYITKVSADRQLKLSLTSTGSSHFVLDITGYFMPAGAADGAAYLPADQRVYDSRDGDGPLAPRDSRVIALPTGAGESQEVSALNGVTPTAAAVNVTVTGTVGPGVMAVAEERTNSTSTVNWTGPAQTVANAVITDVTPEGTFTVTNNGLTPADVVVDLNGRFVPSAAGVGAAFYPMDPARMYDSRTTNGVLGANQSRLNTTAVPTDAVAVALNTTVTGTLGTGYLSVTPPTGAVPQTSTVNWFTSPTTRANGSIVPLRTTASEAYVGGLYATQYVHDTAGFFR